MFDSASRDAGKGRAPAGSSSSLPSFLREAACDFLLTGVVAVSAAYAASFGFTAAADLRGNPLVLTALVAIPLACLLGCTRSRRMAVPCAAAAAVACALEVWVLSVLGGAPLFVRDSVGNLVLNQSEGNYAVLAFVCCASALLSFLLARRRWSIAVAMGGFALLFGAVQFLWPRGWAAEPGAFPAFACGFSALIMELVYDGYRRGLRDAARAGRPRFGTATAFSLPIAISGVAIGFALFLAVIAGSSLVTAEFRPFTRYYAAPTQQQRDEYQRSQVASDQTSSRTDDRQQDSNRQTDGSASAGDSGGSSAFGRSVRQLMASMDPQSYDRELQPFPYHFFRLLPFLVAALVLLVLASAVLWHRGARERLLRKLASRDPAYRVWTLYGFLMERYRRLGWGRRPSQTPMEYALAMRSRMEPFAVPEGGSGAASDDGNAGATAASGGESFDFVRVSLLYQDSVVGHLPVGERAYSDLVRYYRAFFAAAREHVGRVRWLWYFWRM